MDIRFEGKTQRGKSPTTRLYAPTKEDARDQTGRVKAHGGAGERTSGRAAAEEAGVQVKKAEIKPLSRIGLIFCGFVFAGMVVFTLTGYERITRAYADINSLNSEMEETRLRINALDVQIECAVTIQDAQRVAEQYGMRYPDKSQYVRVGDALPFNGASLGTGAGDTDGTAPQTGGDPLDGGEQPPEGG